MLEIIQDVNDDNINAIFARYQALGWGLAYQFFRNGHCYQIRLTWPHEGDPKYPDISDVGGLPPVCIQ